MSFTPSKSIALPETAPDAVSVTGLPTHTAVEPDVLITGIAGNGFTVTVIGEEFALQPSALLTFTL